jgi:hypothetical protein
MWVERGRWADQAAVRMPVAIMASSYAEGVRMSEMGLGGRVVLSRLKDLGADGLQLAELGIERWPCRIAAVESGLLTGDGAVLAVRQNNEAPVSTVCFPLSPTRLLVVGAGFGRTAVLINAMIASRCRRWLVDRPMGTTPLAGLLRFAKPLRAALHRVLGRVDRRGQVHPVLVTVHVRGPGRRATLSVDALERGRRRRRSATPEGVPEVVEGPWRSPALRPKVPGRIRTGQMRRNLAY